MDLTIVTQAAWSSNPSTEDITAINTKIREMMAENKTDGKASFDAWPAPYNCYRWFTDPASAQEWIDWVALQNFPGDDAPPYISTWPFTSENPPAYGLQT